ncbi:phosducin-like protein [Anaeramoeba ignava]|uniref:Phosducin-like protein n=1 Tax=Anaeramoeba ignava TaxID=1746090 RepID=A0A9Q0RGQ0_ANAIG|nr:phosducin-like protein [Anaeramoeba ignava]
MNEMNFHNFKTFGVLGNVSSKTFLKAIEEENPDVLIILHLYSNRLKICQEINQMMTELATKFPRIKFLKGVANELSQGFDDLALPSLVIYKGGKLIDSLIRFTDKLPSNFDIDHFEHFLKKQNFLF